MPPSKDARPLPHNAYKAAIARWCDASYFARVRWRMSDMTDATRNFCLYLRTKNSYFRSPEGRRMIDPESSTAC